MKNMIYFIIFIFFIFGIFGFCSNDKFNENNSNNIEINIDEYKGYENKIWRIKDTNINRKYNCPTFIISNVSSDKIFVKIQMKKAPYPVCYVNTFGKRDYYINMSCKIVKNKVNCSFDDYDGNKCNFALSLKEDGTIIGDINIDFKKNNPENIPNGSYVFSPETIADYDALEDINTIPADLSYWGNINITTGYYICSDPYAMAYITDDDGDILYKFDGMTNDERISSVVIRDVNKDGLKDVKFFMDNKTEYIYIQTDNGLFYDSKLDSDPKIANLAFVP